MNLNLTPSEQAPDHLVGHHFQPGFGLSMASSSSSVPPCHAFFSSDPDRPSYYHPHLPEPDHDQNYVYHGGPSCGIDHKANCGIQLKPPIKKEYHHLGHMIWEERKNIDPLNWMSPKARSTHKAMKSKQKLQASSSSQESELSSNGSACVNSYIPIRVCADCNTTKTPLWRSGPKGPKSLCNACGIRQRKARRAMAAAHENKPTPKVKIKEDYNKKGKRPGRMKKWPKMAASSSNGGDQKKRRRKKKTGLEDFLINLSNSIAFQKVFPQDEKDAAILLMALSSGLVHG